MMSGPAMQASFGWKDPSTAQKYINVAAATKEQLAIMVNNVLN